MPIQLLVKHGPNAGQTYDISSGVSVGSDVQNSIVVPNTALQLFEIRKNDQDGYSITPLSSTPAVYFNGELLESVRTLVDGDEIAIPPEVIYTFHHSDAETTVAKATDPDWINRWQAECERNNWRTVPNTASELLDRILLPGEILFTYFTRGVISSKGSCHLAITDQRFILISPKRKPDIIQETPLAKVRFLENRQGGGPVRKLILSVAGEQLTLIASNQEEAVGFENFLQGLLSEDGVAPLPPQSVGQMPPKQKNRVLSLIVGLILASGGLGLFVNGVNNSLPVGILLGLLMLGFGIRQLYRGLR